MIWFLNTFPIFRYILPVFSHTFIYFDLIWLLNKHEHYTFQKQNAARVFYMNVSLRGTDCLQKSFDDIFILSDKVAFMRGAALFTDRETASSTALKAPPAGRESVCIFNNKPVSSNMLLLLLNLFVFAATPSTFHTLYPGWSKLVSIYKNNQATLPFKRFLNSTSFQWHMI